MSCRNSARAPSDSRRLGTTQQEPRLRRRGCRSTGAGSLPQEGVRDNFRRRLGVRDAAGALPRLMHAFARNCAGLFNGRRPYRDAVGRALQGEPGGFGALLPCLQPPYRTQSGPRSSAAAESVGIRPVPRMGRSTNRPVCRGPTDRPSACTFKLSPAPFTPLTIYVTAGAAGRRQCPGRAAAASPAKTLLA